MPTETQLATTQPKSVKEYLALPAYKDRFAEVLGKRAPQFLAAVTASSNLPQLKDAEPRSVIAAAMVAATLDLPVNPTLGQAHIVAYKDKTGTSIAQFQIGYKGLIQLALRSGQYKRMNAGAVNAEVFAGYDMVGEPALDWSRFDPSKDVGGYFCAFELVNGFTKVVYWSKAQVENHAKRFSKAFQKGYQSSPWFSDFDGMATKTVVKNALTKWGILSVEMQKAAVHDQGSQADVEAEVKYVDGEDKTVEQDTPPDRPAPPKRAAKGAAAVVQNTPKAVAPEVVVPAESSKEPEPAAQAPVESFAQAAEATQTEPVAGAPKPRAFLNDGELLECEVKVLECAGGSLTSNGTKYPSVRAKVSGGYNGDIYHINGGKTEGDKTVPLPPWKAGASLAVKLKGIKNESGAVKAYVESVEVAPEVF